MTPYSHSPAEQLKHQAANQHHRVLVTGGAGFIGSHLVDALIERGYRVFVLDNLSSGSREQVHPRAKLYVCDLTDHRKTAKLFEKIHPTFVFHLAAHIDLRASVENPVFDAATNCLATIHLLQLAQRFGIRKFIFSSTGGAMYGEARVIPTPENAPAKPASPYALSKLAAERYVRYFGATYGLKSVILRYANVYGPRQNTSKETGVVAVFLSKMLSDQNPIINGDGEQTRDYTYVADVVAANIAALERPKVTGIFNVGTGERTSVNQIFAKLNRHFGGVFEEQHGPPKVGETRHSALHTVLAERRLAWKSKVPFDEGLTATILWYKSRARTSSESAS